MSFPQAVSSALRQYVGFRGRARRSEYWWFILFTFLASVAAALVDGLLGLADETGNGPIGGVVSLALLLPTLAVSVRRLHDTSRSGWWVLIGLVPLVGLIFLIIFYVQDSSPGTNQHGPNPKGIDPGYGQGYGAPGQGYGGPGPYGGASQDPDPRFGTPPHS